MVLMPALAAFMIASLLLLKNYPLIPFVIPLTIISILTFLAILILIFLKLFFSYRKKYLVLTKLNTLKQAYGI